MSMQFSFCLKQGQGLRASAAHLYPMFHLSATPPPPLRAGGERIIPRRTLPIGIWLFLLILLIGCYFSAKNYECWQLRQIMANEHSFGALVLKTMNVDNRDKSWQTNIPLVPVPNITQSFGWSFSTNDPPRSTHYSGNGIVTTPFTNEVDESRQPALTIERE